MKRLTNHFDYCEVTSCKYKSSRRAEANQCEFFNVTNRDNCFERNIYNKLREYEQLEEQGLLLKLPCKVGTEVYRVVCRKYGGNFVRVVKLDRNTLYRIVIDGEFGKTVFLTKEEAEAKLQELQNGVTQSNDGVKEGK